MNKEIPMKATHMAHKAPAVLIGASLLALSACHEFVLEPQNMMVPSNMEQSAAYQAELVPINSVGEISGTVNIKLADGRMMVETQFSGPAADSEVMHPQNIRTMSECPKIARHDVNQDGWIDSEEGRSVYGDIMLSLDDDLTSKERSQTYPSSDKSGSYFYSQSVALTEMQEVFKAGNIDLAGKVVVVEGVAVETTLPETVRAMAGQDVHQTLPVACGKLQLKGEATPTPTPSQPPLPEQQRRSQQQVQDSQMSNPMPDSLDAEGTILF
jgi:hypothetical protein